MFFGGIFVHSQPVLPYPEPFAPPGDDEVMARFGYRQQFRRVLGLRHLLVFGLIYMVPIAPFGIFGGVFQASGGMVALAYGIGMVAMLVTAVSYTQMVRAFPMAGSVYNYAGRGIAPPVGFLAGWAMLLDYILVPCLLALIAAVGIHDSLPAIPVWAWITGFVALTTVVNLLGIRITSVVSQWFLIGEIIVLIVFLLVGVWALICGRGQGFSLDPLLDAGTFSWSLVFGAVSLAMLSFLGFDGISMLAEDNRGGPKQIGTAMTVALLLTGALFIAQSWVAALLVPHPDQLITQGDPSGTAFYDAAGVAGGAWLAKLTAVATALAWGIANSLVAQVSTSRLLFAMARDRQLPKALARVSIRRSVPVTAVLLVATVSLTLGVYLSTRDDGITVLSTLVNFGAICAFVVLHASVIWHYLKRRRSQNLTTHLLIPLLGIGLLIAVAINANVLAQKVGLAWIALGALILVILYGAGRRPRLSGMGARS
jgi:amino acid transporter